MDLNFEASFLRILQDKVAAAAAPEANAMAETFQRRVQDVTLREISHAPGMFWKAPLGRPPAYASGNLSRSIIRIPAAGLVRASALVGATAIYSALQEFGGTTRPTRSKYLHWTNSAGPWWMKSVTVPKHPYMRPSLEAVIFDGSLQRSAIDAFMAIVGPFER